MSGFLFAILMACLSSLCLVSIDDSDMSHMSHKCPISKMAIEIPKIGGNVGFAGFMSPLSPLPFENIPA